MERRFLAQEVARVAVEERGEAGNTLLAGTAAVFYDGTVRTEYELWPGVKERIMPGTFDRAVKEDDVRAVFNHNPDWLLGRASAETLKLRVTKGGLAYEIDPADTQMSRDVVEMVRRGDLTGSSFAFRVTDEQWVTEDEVDIRQITGVRLYDVGPVTFPAYESTDVGIRSTAGVDVLRQRWEAWKREAQERDRLIVSTRARAAEVAAGIRRS